MIQGVAGFFKKYSNKTKKSGFRWTDSNWQTYANREKEPVCEYMHVRWCFFKQMHKIYVLCSCSMRGLLMSKRYETWVGSMGGGKKRDMAKGRSADVNRASWGRTKGDWGMVESWMLEHWWGEQHWGEGKLSTKSGEADSEPWPHYSHSPSCSLSIPLSSFLPLFLPVCLSLPPLKCPINYPRRYPSSPPIPPSLSDPLAGCPTWLGERERERERHEE